MRISDWSSDVCSSDLDAVIPLMAEGLLTPYLDIPFQHASPRVLKAMKRPANEAKVLDRLKSWRAIAPDIAIRSSSVVGFPGETRSEERRGGKECVSP